MTTSIRGTIRALARPKHRLSCSPRLWKELFHELHRRGDNRRESGAFLLGRTQNGRRRIEKIVPYDDLDPHCLDSGIVRFEADHLGAVSEICHQTGLELVADVHTHGGAPWQSETDRVHPANPRKGHIALIVPDFARRVCAPNQLGIYEYEGRYKWQQHGDNDAKQFLILTRI
ncbi:MAG TPA: Mov34/MPN/PAD-1 family protein [Abditibacterium sp.]|jgi:proteasome lid subunit RPN8/RPN11